MAKRIPRCRLTGSGGDCETVFEDEVTIAWQNHRIIVVRLIGTTRRGIERLESMHRKPLSHNTCQRSNSGRAADQTRATPSFNHTVIGPCN